MEALGEILIIYFLCIFKFIAGPIGGVLSGWSIAKTALVTVAGMMTAVFLFTYLGQWFRTNIIKRYFKPRRRFNKRNRRFVRIWRSYGLLGVALLTPIIFTPIGGTLLVSAMGERKGRIFVYMLGSAVFWGIIISSLLHQTPDLLNYLSFSS